MHQKDIAFFDPKAEWSIVERGLPHWTQAGCVVFVTYRLADSLPDVVLKKLDDSIAECLRSEKLDPSSDWRRELATLDVKVRGRVQWKLFAIRDKYLDCGYGASQLADPAISALVMESLRKFDEDRYFLTDAVVMPNHLHLLCAFINEQIMLKQCTEWKRFTGRQINSRLGISGEFWQVDQFDHLIRSPEQFDHFRRYIAENPVKANLAPGTFLHFAKEVKKLA